MPIWTQCCIHHSCISGITIVTFRTSPARALASLILEGSIFTSHWLCCSFYAEVTWGAQIFPWCCCGLASRAVVLCSAFLCWCRISCSSTILAGSAISAVPKSCVPHGIRELPCRARNWNAGPWWTVVSNWTVKLIRHSRTVIAVITLGAVSFGSGHRCMWAILTKFTWKRTIWALRTIVASWTNVTWKKNITVYITPQFKSQSLKWGCNFWVCGWSPQVWPFK